MQGAGVCWSWPSTHTPDPLLCNDCGSALRCGFAPTRVSLSAFEMCQPDVLGLHLQEAPSLTRSLRICDEHPRARPDHMCTGAARFQMHRRPACVYVRTRARCSTFNPSFVTLNSSPIGIPGRRRGAGPSGSPWCYTPLSLSPSPSPFRYCVPLRREALRLETVWLVSADGGRASVRRRCRERERRPPFRAAVRKHNAPD